MCDFTKGIKLCSCNGDEIEFRGAGSGKPDHEIPLMVVWTLSRLVYKTRPNRIGKFLFPSAELGEGLDAESIVKQLNEQDCFDFEYTPVEGDCLKIQQNFIGSPFISFLFREGAWRVDWYKPFTAEVKLLQDGLVKESTYLNHAIK